jgi:hypothetical protein
MLMDLVEETNQYSTILDGNGTLPTRLSWKDFLAMTHHSLHEYEETIQCQKLLDKRTFHFS